MEQGNNIEQIHLSDYWNVIVKRKTFVITFMVATVLLTMVISFLMKPVYEATSRMVIDQESNASPITGQRTEYADVQSQLLTFNTHFKLIKSKPVLTNVIKELEQAGANTDKNKISENPIQVILSFVKDGAKQLKKNIFLILQMPVVEPTAEELLDLQLEKLDKQVTISQQRDTRLLTIDVDDNDPLVASQIANILAKKYIEFDLASKLNSSNENIAWLNKEVYAMKKKLEDDEKKFYNFKQENKVFSMTGKQKVIDQKISELNNEYLTTRNRRQELDAKLSEIDKQYTGKADISYIRSIINNTAIDAIYTDLTNLELESSRLSKVFKAKHPKMQQVNDEVAKVRAKLRTELTKEIENLKVERTVLLNREKVMEKSIGEFEDDALNTSSKELKYSMLQRNMDTSQQLYDTMVAKIKETGVVSGATSNVRIVEEASVPLDPIKPNKLKNLLLSLILGVFGGVGLAFFLEYLDQSIRTEEDVQNLLELPVLAVIPIAEQNEHGGYY